MEAIPQMEVFLLCLHYILHPIQLMTVFMDWSRTMVAFGVMSYQYIQKKQTVWAITFGALALLFQPFIKVALGRTMWNIVDVIVAVLLIVLWVKERK